MKWLKHLNTVLRTRGTAETNCAREHQYYHCCLRKFRCGQNSWWSIRSLNKTAACKKINLGKTANGAKYSLAVIETKRFLPYHLFRPDFFCNESNFSQTFFALPAVLPSSAFAQTALTVFRFSCLLSSLRCHYIP